MTGIVIVTYNQPALLIPQLECIRRFCTDEFEVIIVDNSNDKEAAAAIKYHSEGCRYIKVNAASHGGSGSHAFAANMAWLKLKDEFQYLAFIDHDNYPIKPFSVVEMLNGKAIAGLGQGSKKTYFWAGFVMFDRTQVEQADFSCNSQYGLDTGGNLFKTIEKVGIENCVFFGEEYHENNQFQCENPKYNCYTIIAETFMHFVGGSNWEGLNRNEERINTLLNILKERVECVAV